MRLAVQGHGNIALPKGYLMDQLSLYASQTI